MNIPGFTAENSIYNTINHFQSEAARSFGSGKNDNQVYMQRRNSENTPGAECHASSTAGHGENIYKGYYNSEGKCCGPMGCINCDSENATCGDGHTQPRISHPFTIGNFQSGFLALV